MLKIISPSDLSEELTLLHKTGLPAGDSTGWPNVDEFYTVKTGFWTVVTGIPSHGKSTWLDNLMLNLIHQGWKFIVYSPENQPQALYMALLIEKMLQRPFRQKFHNCLRPADIAEGVATLEDSLRLLAFDDGAVYPSIETFMSTCDEIINNEWEGHDRIGVVIDPINELDVIPIGGMSETQYTSWMLMRYRQWIRRNGNIHGWIVAHPAKPQKDKNGDFKDVCLYDISGSSAWKNKSDFGIIVRRREEYTEIDVEKCRWRHLGKQGNTQLRFETGTGTYHDAEFRGGSYRRFGEDDSSY